MTVNTSSLPGENHGHVAWLLNYLFFMNRKQANKLETFRNVSNWRIRLSQSVLKLTLTRKWQTCPFLSRSRILFLSPWSCFLSFLLSFCLICGFVVGDLWLQGSCSARRNLYDFRFNFTRFVFVFWVCSLLLFRTPCAW